MKRIGLTQRADDVPGRAERRDSLDQNWTRMVTALGAAPVPLPNCAPWATRYLQTMVLDGVILTGGNDPASLSGAVDPAPERDRFEEELLRFCRGNSIPVLGVCRGMQMINISLGGRLERVPGHVRTRHTLDALGPCAFLPQQRSVNSFHNIAIPRDGLAEALLPLALGHDQTVECFRHRTEPIVGVMWHPEREAPFDPADLAGIGETLRL